MLLYVGCANTHISNMHELVLDRWLHGASVMPIRPPYRLFRESLVQLCNFITDRTHTNGSSNGLTAAGLIVSEWVNVSDCR